MKTSPLKPLAAGALLLGALLLAGCYNPQATPVGGYPPGQTAAPFPGYNTNLPPINTPQALPGAPSANPASPLLRIGDMIIIEWFDTVTQIPQYKERIRDDGKLILPYNVIVHAAGKTIAQLQDDIRSAYVPNLYRNLTISVKTEERFYYVGGEVRSPGRQYYYGDITVLRAIDTAGGFTDFASRNNIELRRLNGEIVKLNWKKVMRNSKLDQPVYPNDQIIVHKRLL